MRTRDAIRPFLAVALVVAGLTAVAAPAGAAEEVYPAPASGAWTVDGRAYGHGRGMSQWGTQAAALQGVTAAQMLDFYYPGTVTTDLRTLSGQSVPFVKTTLADYAPSTSVTVWAPAGRTIRMGTLAQEVAEPSGFWTVTVDGTTVTARRSASLGGPVLDTRTYTVGAGSAVRFESGGEEGMIIAAPPTSAAYPNRAGLHRWYRGDIRIEPTGGHGFDVTNSLPMEEYLRSVVPRESPASWQPAALQAQAVAARSYAWHKVAHGSTLCDTTSCQVYYGRGDADTAGTLTRSWEHPNSDAAIAATAHQVRTYGGAIAFTEFSSSNGGWTTAGGYPYQVAKADPWTGSAPGDTVTSWTTTLSVARVQQSCPSGGTLRNLVVESRTGNGPLGGRINRVRLECTTGTAYVNTPAFGLRSSWWRPRFVAPVLENPGVSATTIAHGDQMSIGVTPSVALTWTLTVTDRTTGATVWTISGPAQAGQRFNATWFGGWAGSTPDAPYVGPGVYDLVLSAVDGAGNVAPPFRTAVTVLRPADPPAVTAVPLRGDGGYVPVPPTRLVDTRTSFQALGPGQRADVVVAGRAGVPADATAVALNVTAVHATTHTHLRVWPAGAPMPGASSVNTDASRTQAAMVTVGVGGEGKVSVYNAAGTLHYIVDVLGYYTTDTAGSARYTPVDPVRALDTRAGGGSALGGDAARVVDVAAVLGVPPASVSAVAVNLTTPTAAGPGYVVAYGGGEVPATSSVNLSTSGDVANRAVVPVVDGTITVRLRGGPAHVVVDVVGWYGAPGAADGDLFTPVQPTRLLDTRPSAAFGPRESRTVGVVGGQVPADATAVVGTLTATEQTAPVTHARIWPAGLPLTPTSDLNSGAGRTQANAVVVRVGAGGAVQLYNDQGRSQLILDVVGYFR